MSLSIPWWLKILFKLMLSKLPFGYSIWKRIGLFKHGSMDRPDYAFSVFITRTNIPGFVTTLSGKTILELGPGDSIASAIIAASYGANAILVDVGLFARFDLDFAISLTNFLREKGFSPPELGHCTSNEDILRVCNAKYLTSGLDDLIKLPSNSIDIIFSQAVLEHIRRHQFVEIVRQLRRILKNGGVCSHQVDLRDHLGGSLNNLRFGDKIWESDWFSSAGFYTNRIRLCEMLSIFTDAGFTAETSNVVRWVVSPIDPKSISSDINISSDDLLISQFDILLH